MCYLQFENKDSMIEDTSEELCVVLCSSKYSSGGSLICADILMVDTAWDMEATAAFQSPERHTLTSSNQKYDYQACLQMCL